MQFHISICWVNVRSSHEQTYWNQGSSLKTLGHSHWRSSWMNDMATCKMSSYIRKDSFKKTPLREPGAKSISASFKLLPVVLMLTAHWYLQIFTFPARLDQEELRSTGAPAKGDDIHNIHMSVDSLLHCHMILYDTMICNKWLAKTHTILHTKSQELPKTFHFSLLG